MKMYPKHNKNSCVIGKKLKKVSFSLNGDLLLQYSLPWCKPGVGIFQLMLFNDEVIELNLKNKSR